MRRTLFQYLLIVLVAAALLSCAVLQATPAPTPTAEATVAATVTATAEAVQEATATSLPDALLEPIDIEEQLITNLYERVGPAVVHITSHVITMDFFFGPVPEEGTGSGFVWDREGHIVTNYHVIEGAESIEVALSDEVQVPAQVVGVDPANDLAVLKIEVAAEQLVPVELGTSADLRVGQRAIAIGNPFGLDRTLTVGVISALGRPLQTNQDNFIYNVVQTDAAINPGNSGGPLLDSRGRVIGVNTAIRQGAEGIGFAVPVDTVKRVVPVLVSEGRYPHPWLGFLGYSITPEWAETLQLPVERGILVAQLYRQGPAVAAGLQGATQEVIVGNRRVLVGGDIVTAVNGVNIPNWDALAEYLELNTQVGDEVTLTIIRGGQTLELPIMVGEQPQ